MEDKYEEALPKYNQVISETKEDDEKLPLFLSNRAHCLIGMNRLDEAQADCERAIKLDDKCQYAYVTLSKQWAYRQKLGPACDVLR